MENNTKHETKQPERRTHEPRVALTTEAVGIVKNRQFDLNGYIITPEELEDAVRRVWTILGFNTDERDGDIRCVKIATTENNSPRIISEVRWGAIKNKREEADRPSTWCEIRGGGRNDGDKGIPQFIYDALRNKAFRVKDKNLHWEKIERKDGVKYVRFEFDPRVFVAFIFNINFEDPYYRLSAPISRWTNRDKFDTMSNWQVKTIARKEQEMKNDKLFPAIYYATMRAGFYTKAADGTHITGFHPKQVERTFNIDESRKKNKK